LNVEYLKDKGRFFPFISFRAKGAQNDNQCEANMEKSRELTREKLEKRDCLQRVKAVHEKHQFSVSLV